MGASQKKRRLACSRLTDPGRSATLTREWSVPTSDREGSPRKAAYSSQREPGLAPWHG
jgi:hypothetical protein